MKSLLILGRQPALGLAELESLYGAKVLKPLFPNAVLVDLPAKEIDFKRLGGSIKLTTVLNILHSTNWKDIEVYLQKMVPEHLQYVPAEGKFHLGLSAYGLKVHPGDINSTALRLKKLIKETRPVRVIPNKTQALSSAQVIHNQLTGDTGWELVFYRNGQDTILCLTVMEQDIEAYSARDQNRPKRDAKVGMLPPKLAQIIINLAVDRVQGSGLRAQSDKITILDPFCGTGVILQEALLMGYSVYGSDIEPRMVEYSLENLDWLRIRMNGDYDIRLEPGDAIRHNWALGPEPSALVVAAETYLGKPLSREPNEAFLKPIIAECDQIHRGFLSNFARQARPGTRLCLAVPAWRYKNGFKHLKTLDYLRELGYTRIDLKLAPASDLIYFRPDQFVARELVVLVKD